MRNDNLAWPMQPLAAIIGGVMLFSLALAKENSPVPVHKERLREGTHLLDAPGRFEAAGDRISFVMEESGQSIGVLENLALDRIFRVLRENRGRTQWSVSGTITEYNETNYLLLTKAVQVVKTAPQDSAKASGIGTRPKVDYPVPPGKVPAEKNVDKKPEPSNDKRP
jgi:hypothetical protein